MKKILLFALVYMMTMGLLTGCDRSVYAESENIVISAKELSSYIGAANTVIVDVSTAENYAVEHVQGAVNIPISSVLVSLPVDNMLASKAKVSGVLGDAGIDKDTMVILYDEGKSLNASRLWWTMLCYGHQNFKVVSGGLPAVKEKGIGLTAEVPVVVPKEYQAEDLREQYVADMFAIQDQVDNPQENVILLDVRSEQEYLDEGRIPGSVIYPHSKIFYKDGALFDAQAIRINFIEKDIRAENEIIIYCKTSMRAAPVFLSLYDAGYRNLKIYDGAWLEWSGVSKNPIEFAEGAPVASGGSDNS